jgi:hypothetical protein
MGEPQPTQPAAKPQRSKLSLLLLILAIGGSAIGVYIYQTIQANRKTQLDASGFDVAQTLDRPAALPAASGAPGQDQSNMMTVQTGLPGMHFSRSSNSSPAAAAEDKGKKAAEDFTELCRANETKVRNFAIAWTRKSVVLQAYGKEWMSYPDLKKLNDDYMHNHDPVSFLRGLAQSDNFSTMVKRYAGQPDIQHAAQEGMKQAPPELFNSALAYANKDNIIKTMVDKVGQSLGIPPGVMGSAAGGGQVDTSKVMDSVLSANPQMQQMMQNNPELQKQVQGASHQ